MRMRAASLAPQLFKTPVPSVRLGDPRSSRSPGGSGSACTRPGHTEDHLCLFDPTEGVMLSGDHVLPTITPHIGGFHPQRRPVARLLRVARQGRRLRAGRHDRAARPRPPVRRPRRRAPRRSRSTTSSRLDLLRQTTEDLGRPANVPGVVDAPVLAACARARWPTARRSPTSSTCAAPARSSATSWPTGTST